MKPTEKLSREQAFFVLNALQQIGPVTVRRLLDAFGNDPALILEAGTSQLKRVQGVDETRASILSSWRNHFDISREERRLADSGAEFLTRDSEGYPPLLNEVYDPPVGLYSKGGYRIGVNNVAIVGTRRATLYGLSVAKKLASGLARSGFCIVSGLARGIDAAAHEGALEVGGTTVAVLGCGIDIVYPPENIGLYKRIAEQGALLSEFPFGRKADRQTFPMRNRLVAGMCRGVIVVESDIKGGSLITARFAMEQNRQVFAVPGRVDQVSSSGCHELIRDGAVLVRHVEDVLEELQWGAQMSLPVEQDEPSPGVTGLPVDEAEAFRVLTESGIQKLDTLADLLGKPVSEVASTLLLLELKKLVVKRADGAFEARP